MAEPTDLPIFDENDTNTIPISTELQDDGFSLNNRPASGTFNSWFRNVYKWVEWFQEKFNSVDSNIDRLAPVDSIADLRTVAYTPLSGAELSVLGYYTPGDGGGGQFYWDATNTEIDNNSTIIKVASLVTGRWKRVEIDSLSMLNFGAVGDGDGAGGGTDDSVAVQRAFDYLLDNQGILYGDGRVYRCDSQITCVSDDVTQQRATKRLTFDGQGCKFDFTSGTWASDYTSGEQTALLQVGTISNTSQPDNPSAIVEQGIFSFTNFAILGDETLRPTTPDATVPTQGTIGLRLSLAQNVNLTDITIIRCTVGIETKDSWGITGKNVYAVNCWIGFNIAGGSTYATWITSQSVQCAYGVIVRTSTQAASPIYGAYASVQCQEFINHRAEDCWYGFVLSPTDADIRSVQIINCYSEGLTYDFIEAGYLFQQSNIADPSSNFNSFQASLIVDRLYVNTTRLSYTNFALRAPQSTAMIVKGDINLPIVPTDIEAGFLNSVVRSVEIGDTGVTNYYGETGDISFRILEGEGGIQLNNSSNLTATALDYYLEGTFTPGISSATPPSGVTYVLQIGKYTRIGNVVNVTIRLSWSAMAGSPSGRMFVTGLPFAAEFQTDLIMAVNVIGNNVAYTNNIGGLIVSGSSEISLIDHSAGAYADIAVDTSGELFITFQYFAPS